MTPQVNPQVKPVTDRLLRNCSVEQREMETPCYLWKGAVDHKGYAVAFKANRMHPASRITYEEAHGVELPWDTDVHHKCSAKHCINPDHLEALSKRNHQLRHNERIPLADIPALLDEVASAPWGQKRKTQEKIAARYGVSAGRIQDLKTRLELAELAELV